MAAFFFFSWWGYMQTEIIFLEMIWQFLSNYKCTYLLSQQLSFYDFILHVEKVSRMTRGWPMHCSIIYSEKNLNAHLRASAGRAVLPYTHSAGPRRGHRPHVRPGTGAARWFWGRLGGLQGLSWWWRCHPSSLLPRAASWPSVAEVSGKMALKPRELCANF